MANFEVKKNPEFSSTARKLETTDRAHADLFNDLYQKMFDNDNFLKESVDNKANKDGGDIANTTVSEFSEETGEFPELNPGEATKTLFGKVKKFIEDFKAWYTGVCLIGHIVNNCTSGATNMPLSAAQGRALMQLYTQLNSDFITFDDNTIIHEETVSSLLRNNIPIFKSMFGEFKNCTYHFRIADNANDITFGSGHFVAYILADNAYSVFTAIVISKWTGDVWSIIYTAYNDVVYIKKLSE